MARVSGGRRRRVGDGERAAARDSHGERGAAPAQAADQAGEVAREQYVRTPPEEIAARLSRFQAAIQADSLDGALVLQTVDLFYFTGAAQNAALFVPAQGEPALFVRKSRQ